MGFLDRATSKMKTSVSTTSNKVSENREVGKIESQIKEERNKVKGAYEAIGKEYYRYATDNDESHKAAMDSLVKDINESRKLIEEYEAQIDEIRANAKSERDSIRAEADAKLREKAEAEQQAKAEKLKAERESDDLF